VTRWALLFGALALLAGVMGFTGWAGVAGGIARALAVLLGALALFTAALAVTRRRSP
jgi:uncharacterized membrane protein YtjA (UPF0391 family)